MEAIESPKVWGRYVESAIGAYLVSQAPIHDFKVYYWRERKEEVDFVIVRRRKIIAIEVKSGRRTTNEGLGKFKEFFKPYKAFVVGSGGFPIEDFLTMDLELLFV